jgi:hypothetical protein
MTPGTIDMPSDAVLSLSGKSALIEAISKANIYDLPDPILK